MSRAAAQAAVVSVTILLSTCRRNGSLDARNGVEHRLPGEMPADGSGAHGFADASTDVLLNDGSQRRDAPSEGTAIQCGGSTCRPSEICIVQNTCTGGTVRCMRRSPGSQCPEGWTPGTCMMAEGCLPPPCTPPPPTCKPRPQPCVGVTGCGCLPPDTCGAGRQCISYDGQAVICEAQ
jgi:hypothetical protein